MSEGWGHCGEERRSLGGHGEARRPKQALGEVRGHRDH